jgi:hypothetical protein
MPVTGRHVETLAGARVAFAWFFGVVGCSGFISGWYYGLVMGDGNVKVQTGLRVDKLVLERFKALCAGERLRVGEAVQQLMETCLAAGSVLNVLTAKMQMSAGQRKADELKLRGALAELKGFTRAVEANEYLFVSTKHRETRIDQAIYRPAYDVVVALLPKVQDEALIREAEQVLNKANAAVERLIGE